MKTKNKILLITTIVCFCTACKTKQNLTQPPSVIKDTEFFCTQIIKNEPQFSTLNISKMNIGLTIGQQSWNLYGSLRMQTDSTIIVSLQPLLGFEIFRLELYQNHIRIFDKLNKKYFKSSYDYLSTFTAIPINFSLLQNILKQKLFVIGREMKEDTFNDYFLLEKVGETYNLTSSSGDGKILHRIGITDDYKIKNIDLSIFLEGSSTQISYSEISTFKKITYPKNITIAFLSKNNNAKLSFDITKAIFNDSIDLMPIDFSRYKEVTFNQLLTK